MRTVPGNVQKSADEQESGMELVPRNAALCCLCALLWHICCLSWMSGGVFLQVQMTLDMDFEVWDNVIAPGPSWGVGDHSPFVWGDGDSRALWIAGFPGVGESDYGEGEGDPVGGVFTCQGSQSSLLPHADFEVATHWSPLCIVSMLVWPVTSACGILAVAVSGSCMYDTFCLPICQLPVLFAVHPSE